MYGRNMLGREGEGGEEGEVGGCRWRRSTDRLCDTGGEMLHLHIIVMAGWSGL